MSLLPHGIGLALNLIANQIKEISNSKLIIAIDGFSSSGKSTLAKDLSKVLNLSHIDSGAMYRAVSLYCDQHEIDITNVSHVDSVLDQIEIDFKTADGKNITLLNGEDVESKIRTVRISQIVSDVARISAVRKKLVDSQRRLALDKGVIMDGRDIGSVVFPNAHVKFFVTASIEVRCNRRHNELIEKGINVSEKEILENLKLRDEIDSTRKDSPLVQTDDAHLLDTSNMGRSEMLAEALNVIISTIKKEHANQGQ